MNSKIDRAEEREQVCGFLLKSGRFSEVNPARLQSLVKKANFYSIYHELALQNKDYKAALHAIYQQDKSNSFTKTIQFIRIALSK